MNNDTPLPGMDVQRYADKAMYPAEMMPTLEPKVYLLSMNPDPLGSLAAMSGIYEGKVFRRLSEITDDQRRYYWEQVAKTHLKAPLESIKLHFLIEGVDRAFTHQLVRQRTAVYAQESMRFAVKENLGAETPYPPSFSDPRVVDSASRQNDLHDIWDGAMQKIDQAYNALIASGVPAEDARGLLPTATLTRIHYITDLRNLLEHAGNRLCTQAQFHWRTVFMQIRECIRNYPETGRDQNSFTKQMDAWQFDEIANTAFKPACYLQGHCPFHAEFDRGCTIRSRVDQFAKNGIASENWGDAEEFDSSHEAHGLTAIQESEWAEDPQAAWVRN